jgi:hypothetical protein
MDQSVSHFIMYALAVTLVACVLLVLAFKGISAVPHGWIGVIVAGLLAIAALAMTRLKFGDAPGH